MDQTVTARDGCRLQVRTDGASDPAAPAVVFLNSLATDLSLWDAVLPHLPDALRTVRMDMRGHGRSDVPDGPYAMGTLVSDAEAVCDAARVRGAVVVGLSVGGLVAQGLAVKRGDLMRGLVLSNTGARIGTPALWQDRIDTALADGMAPLAPATMQRWFGGDFRGGPDLPRWQALFESTPPAGYAGVCAAISGTDFYATTATLRLSTLGIAGSEDAATPPDLVRETVDLIPGSKFEILRRAGHLPCVEQPEAYAALLTAFLRGIGHV